LSDGGLNGNLINVLASGARGSWKEICKKGLMEAFSITDQGEKDHEGGYIVL